MRKDRNTFFSESNMFQSNYPQGQMMQGQMPMQQPMMMPNPAPYQASTASNAFYSGPNPNMANQMAPGQMIPQQQVLPAQTIPNYNQGGTTELESRLAKMERQIRRLETRVNKLESNYGVNTFSSGIEEIDTSTSQSMYMI